MKEDSVESKTRLPRWFNGVSVILKNLRRGSLEIMLPDKRSFIFEGKEKGPMGLIFVKNNDFFSRIIREGDNGFPESYMDGWWDTPDLLAVLDVIMLNNKEIGYSFPGTFLLRNSFKFIINFEIIPKFFKTSDVLAIATLWCSSSNAKNVI